MLSSAIRSNELLNSGDEALRRSILELTVRTFQNVKDNPLNHGKEYGFDDFKILLELSVCVWNISFLASSRVGELLEYVENDHFKAKLREIKQWARSRNVITKLMILEAIPSEDDKDYSIDIQTARPDKEMIEDNIGFIMGAILDGVDYMVENGGKK
jgi:hypothetical protein